MLTSKGLFRNWLSAGIRYYLIMRGLVCGSITVKCNDVKYVLSPRISSAIVNACYDGLFNPLCGGDVVGKF